MKEILNDINSGWDFSVLLNMLLSVVPSLFCITFHELSHGFVAYLLGDDTAKKNGRLTLNPIRHIDIMGLLMMTVFRFGWAKPVPVDMRKFRNPKSGMALVALAGPVSNLLLAVVFLFFYGLLYFPLGGTIVGSYALQMLSLGAYISIALAVFNLIPIPPLDGSKVLFSFISNKAYRKLMRYERYGSLLMILLIATGILSMPLSRATLAVFNFLEPIVPFAAKLIP